MIEPTKGPYALYLYILKYGYYVNKVDKHAESYIVYLNKDLAWKDDGTDGTAKAYVKLTPRLTPAGE